MHSKRNELLLATKEDGHIYMHTLRSPNTMEIMMLELPEDNDDLDWELQEDINDRDWEIMAISEQGDVACFKDGYFIINKPGSSQNSPFTIGNDENNWGGQTCFAGENRFVYCGEKYGEIATAVRKRDGWGDDWTLDAYEDKLAFKLKHHHSLITDVGYDGTRLVVRVKGFPINGEACKEPDQGLLTCDEVEDHKVVVGRIVAKLSNGQVKSSRCKKQGKKQGKSSHENQDKSRRRVRNMQVVES
jgi:hypothetical protein